MKIRTKISVLFIVSWALIVFSIFMVSQLILKQSFQQLENQQVERNLGRVNESLGDLLNNVRRVNLDWAHWDDTYQFIQDLNKNYIKANLSSTTTFTDTAVDMFLYFDKNGQYKRGNVYDPTKGQFIPLPEELKPYLKPDSILVKHENEKSAFLGIMRLPQEGFLLISSLPILTSEKKGPVAGTLLMIKYLAEEELEHLRKVTKLSINLLPIKDAETSAKINEAYQNLNAGLKNYIAIKDQKTVQGYSLLKDIYNKPIGLFQVDVYREVWQQGKKTIEFYILALMTAGLIIILLLWIFLKKILIDRLINFRNQISDITSRERFDSNITLSGDKSKSKDELTDIGESVNTMLTVIQAAHKELGKRVVGLTELTNELNSEVERRKKVEENLLIKEKLLEQLAHHDTLTGLPNRPMFIELLTHALAKAKRSSGKVAVLFFDLDHFKNVNDTLGHPTGDALLTILGKDLDSQMRRTDVVSRMGGDEFALFTEFNDVLEVTRVAEKILKLASREISIQNNVIQVTVSIGIALYPADGLTVEELMSHADVALYKAKENGRNQYCYCQDLYNTQVKEKVQLESELRKAVINNELRLFLQPIVRLSSQEMVGMEALVRWQHPKLGLLDPDKFIPLAEKTNLIFPIGEWMIAKACEFHAKNEALYGNFGFIAINFSALQFRSNNFITNIVDNITKSKMNPASFVVEITESVLMASEGVAIENLTKLKKLDIKTAIDDFGTGYSSLSHLSKFPITFLKMDKGFLEGKSISKNNKAIIKAVIVLGHSLDLTIIFEGIETEEQLNYLKELECDLGQGYMLNDTVSENDMAIFLEEKFKTKKKSRKN